MALQHLRPLKEPPNVNLPFVTAFTGLSYTRALPAVGPPGPVQPVVPAWHRRSWRQDPDNPPWSVGAAGIGEAAMELAAEQGVEPGLLHVVLSILTHNREDSGRRFLERAGVDWLLLLEETRRRL